MNAWKYPLLDVKIGSRKVGRSEVQCPVCERTFNNNLPWNAQYCPMCGAYNGYRNEVKKQSTKQEQLKRQIHYLYHNAPDELKASFDKDFPTNRKLNDIREV